MNRPPDVDVVLAIVFLDREVVYARRRARENQFDRPELTAMQERTAGQLETFVAWLRAEFDIPKLT